MRHTGDGKNRYGTSGNKKAPEHLGVPGLSGCLARWGLHFDVGLKRGFTGTKIYARSRLGAAGQVFRGRSQPPPEPAIPHRPRDRPLYSQQLPLNSAEPHEGAVRLLPPESSSSSGPISAGWTYSSAAISGRRATHKIHLTRNILDSARLPTPRRRPAAARNFRAPATELSW
jgi:hypothetical protein